MKTMIYISFLIFFITLLGACQQSASSTEKAAPPVVWTVHPLADADRAPLRLVGVVEPMRQSHMGFQVAGRIMARHVEVGDSVHAGQLLYQLDDRDYRLALKNLQAQLQAVTSDLNTAQKDLKRLQDLLQHKLVSQQQVDAALNRVQLLQAQRQGLLPQIETAQNRLAYTRLKASEDGVVLARQGEVGEVVAVGTPVVTLALGAQKGLALDWPVAMGEPPKTLSVRLDGRQMTLSQDYLSVQVDARSHTRRVRYRLPEAIGTLGEIVPVTVQTGAGMPLWRVPSTALQLADGQAYLYKVTDQQTLSRVPVEVVRMGHRQAWVKGALSGQDQIVRMGVHLLRPGEAVRVGTP